MQAKTKELLQQFKTALLQCTDHQLALIIGGWANAISTLDDMPDLDDFIASFGYSFCTDENNPDFYLGETISQPSPDALRAKVAAMEIQDINQLTEMAFQSISADARDEGDPSPPTGQEGIARIIELVGYYRDHLPKALK